MQKVIEKTLQELIKKFGIQEVSGLNIQDAVILIQDPTQNADLEFNSKNKSFRKAKKGPLFLPHCCRKYMDSRCQAVFEPTLNSYVCAHCSPDCYGQQVGAACKRKRLRHLRFIPAVLVCLIF